MNLSEELFKIADGDDDAFDAEGKPGLIQQGADFANTLRKKMGIRTDAEKADRAANVQATEDAEADRGRAAFGWGSKMQNSVVLDRMSRAQKQKPLWSQIAGAGLTQHEEDYEKLKATAPVRKDYATSDGAGGTATSEVEAKPALWHPSTWLNSNANSELSDSGKDSLRRASGRAAVREDAARAAKKPAVPAAPAPAASTGGAAPQESEDFKAMAAQNEADAKAKPDYLAPKAKPEAAAPADAPQTPFVPSKVTSVTTPTAPPPPRTHDGSMGGAILTKTTPWKVNPQSSGRN